MNAHTTFNCVEVDVETEKCTLSREDRLAIAKGLIARHGYVTLKEYADKALKNYYEQLLERGTYWVHASRMQDRMESLEFRWKSEDVIGLQIADLVAYPLTRHVLNPEEVNYAYDIIKQNIYKHDGKLLGLKIFP